jgi:transposase-like protein
MKYSCPHCNGDIIKSGTAYTKNGGKQNYECKKCHRHTMFPKRK